MFDSFIFDIVYAILEQICQFNVSLAKRYKI